MLAGHTKFAPDRCFGIIKKSYRSRFVSSLYYIAEAIEESSVIRTNLAQIIGHPDGTTVVPVFDWTKFFNGVFQIVPGLLKYHHFRVDSTEPGIVFAREFADSDEIRINILKSSFPVGHPDIIPPKGLLPERKQYLFKEIRQFCKAGYEDLVAPHPDR